MKKKTNKEENESTYMAILQYGNLAILHKQSYNMINSFYK